MLVTEVQTVFNCLWLRSVYLGDSVATYLACVTWCLVKLVVETLD